MANILIIYSTTDGHTIEICQEIQSILETQANIVELISIDNASDVDLAKYDKLVIGASIRYGKHNKSVLDFINRQQEILENMPSAFFSVNVVARKANKDRPDNNPYMKKFLQQVLWKPAELEVFAGKIDYQKYRFFDRQMIRLIMYITKGPTDPKSVNDFTNWEQVRNFAGVINKM
jgi:menaquinone-dependent protoporphyrinogen oxidase